MWLRVTLLEFMDSVSNLCGLENQTDINYCEVKKAEMDNAVYKYGSNMFELNISVEWNFNNCMGYWSC